LILELSAALTNQTNVINQRLMELIEQQVHADAHKERLILDLFPRANTDFRTPTFATDIAAKVSIAPVKTLPVPQISLQRPNPVADLIVTREFKTYLDFFRASSSARSRLTLESQAILYAL